MLAGLAACEKVTHENIDRWENTESGEEKLRSALAGDHDPELRAHAAQVLIGLGEIDHVLETLEATGDRERQALLPPLVDRLSREAHLEGELTRPQSHHVFAKDALFDLRRLATPALRTGIDRYLIDWLTGGYYEGRAKSGRHSGRRIVRGIGPMAGEALVESAREILDKPPTDEGRVRLGDELLGSLALSGDPGALGFLLDLIEKPQADTSLPQRAAEALREAYVEPQAIEAAPGSALGPVAGRLQSLAMAGSTPPPIADIAIRLLAAMPECLPAFKTIVAHEHENPSFRWVGLQNGIRCAGVAGIAPLAEALPTRAAYPRAMLDRYFWREIRALPDKPAVAAEARQLLQSDSWVAKVTAVELLGKLGVEGHRAGDAKRVEKLAGERTRLRGWYPKTDRKPDPTLGQVAAEVARRLREVAQPTKSK